MSKITIVELAELAQVSKSTVSKALNGLPGVSEKKRQKIIKLADYLGYEPDSTAQSMTNKRTGNIGLVIPHTAQIGLRGGYWSQMISSITTRASESDYSLVLLTSREEGEIEDVCARVIKRRRVDGLIIGADLLDKKSLSSLLVQEIPFVLLGKIPGIHHYGVDVDSRAGARDMTRYMIRQGYERIALLSGPEEYYYTRERIDGFQEAMAESGLPADGIYHARYTRESVFEGIGKIFREYKPDSLFLTSGGEFLFDALEALNERQLTYPEFGLSTFDDYRFMDLMSPRITAVSQPFSRMGFTATEMLLTLIAGEIPPGEEVMFKPSINPRKSLGE